MPDVAKLKKKAAEFELKKQFDKALVVYVEILESYDSTAEDIDVSLFNRVGDMYLKQGSVAEAVDYYEQAVDRYAEGGFHNNAIALCNKILRNSPGRASVYYKLGKISAQKGFKGDAKKNFLEYADRMQSSGKTDEAFRALKEFADLCPDQDDIRQMLADQLSKKGRTEEALEQLQQLYERYTHEGRATEASATIDRMKKIDPAYEPRELGSAPRRSAGDLVFLDLSDTPPPPRQSIRAKRATLGLDIIEEGIPLEPPRPTPAVALSPVPSVDIIETQSIEPAILDGVTRAAEFEIAADAGQSLLDGLETTSVSQPPMESGALLDFEPTSFEQPVEAIDDLAIDIPSAPTPAAGVPELIDLELPEFDAPPIRNARASLMGLPMLTDEDGEDTTTEDDEATIGGDLELIMPDVTPPVGSMMQPAADDLPLMDLDLPMAGEAGAAISGALGRNSLEVNFTPIDLSAVPAPETPRPSTAMAEQSAEVLQALCDADPDDNTIRRRLAEAKLESGDREGGLAELETVMIRYERAEDLNAASSVADEIVLLNPASVRHHQKRVELAFRTNERPRLIEAYLQLADALFRAGQVEKSRAIYQRVIDLSPDDVRARAAFDTFPAPDAPPEPAVRARATVPQQRLSQPTPAASMPAVPPPVPDDEFINLGDWLRDDEAPKDTRMIVDEQEPTGDEEADFQDMLRKFKQGISENVEDEDHQSHYDLGVAFKEMGLMDEAIAEFQKALRAPNNRVPTYEALGQCFMEKEQYPMAATVLGRALAEPAIKDEQLVGVLYLLGQCSEARGDHKAAVEYYQRVFVVDIQFRDIGDRLAAAEGAAK